MQSNITHKQIEDILKEAGLKITGPRNAICSFLLNAKDHPTALQIFEGVKKQYTSHANLSLATVYKTLDRLLQKTIIHEFDPGDGLTHYEPTLIPHINLICTKCGEIQDYYDSDIDSFVQTIQSRITHSSAAQHLEFYHLCDQCSKT